MNSDNHSVESVNQEVLRKHIWHALLYEYHKGSSFKEALEKIHNLYGENCVSVMICESWYKEFKESDKGLPLNRITTKSNIVGDSQVIEFIKNNPNMSLDEMTQILSMDINTLSSYKKRLNHSSTNNRKRPSDFESHHLLCRPVQIPKYNPQPLRVHQHHIQNFPFSKFSAYPIREVKPNKEVKPRPRSHLLEELLGKPFKPRRVNSVLEKLLSKPNSKQIDQYTKRG